MHRLGATLFIGLSLFVMAPASAAAAVNMPILNPDFAIVPEVCKACPCGFGGALQLIQNLVNAGVALAIVVVIIVIAWAGITFMLTPTNPENRTKARQMLTNAIIGLVILLSAWVMVDFVMKILYRAGEGKSGDFLPWNEIITGGDVCIVTNTKLKPLFSGSIGDFFTQVPGSGSTGPGGDSGGGGGGSSGPISTTGRGACNATEISNAAAAAGVTIPAREANLLACLAGPESQCGAVMKNYNWDAARKPPPSTAYGPFQITLKGNGDCFETPACYKAASVSGPLNCKAAFTSSGYSIPGKLLQQCQTAAANLSCSAAAAHCVYKRQGASAWTADASSAKQQACINRIGG